MGQVEIYDPKYVLVGEKLVCIEESLVGQK